MFRSIKTSLLCGIALIMLAAFPVFAQDYARPNKRPFQDFTEKIINQVQTGELDLENNFLVEMEGNLTKGGKLDLKNTKFVRTEGNEQMANAAKDAIEAVNDSGILIYLSQMNATKLRMILAQTDAEIYGTLNFEVADSTKLKKVKSSLDIFLIAAKNFSKDEDEKTFLNGTTISEDGKTVTIKTAVEKSAGQEIINRRLNEEINRKSGK